MKKRKENLELISISTNPAKLPFSVPNSPSLHQEYLNSFTHLIIELLILEFLLSSFLFGYGRQTSWWDFRYYSNLKTFSEIRDFLTLATLFAIPNHSCHARLYWTFLVTLGEGKRPFPRRIERINLMVSIRQLIEK